MTKKIDSGALEVLDRALGIAGGGSAETTLEDGTVTQVVDVAPIVRRSLPMGGPGTSGIYTAVMDNTHAAANTQTSSIDPYAPGAALAIAPYAAVVPQKFDVWLVGVSSLWFSGTIAEASLRLTCPAAFQGWGVDQAGAAVAAAEVPLTLMHFDQRPANLGVLDNAASGITYIQPALRLRRGTEFDFVSVSSDAARIQLILMLSVTPVGMGQDVTDS